MDEFTEASIAGLMGRQISIHRYALNLFTPQGCRAALRLLFGLVFCSLLSFITLKTPPEVARNEPWNILGYVLTPITFLLVFARAVLLSVS